jgi:hypothetical protein
MTSSSSVHTTACALVRAYSMISGLCILDPITDSYFFFILLLLLTDEWVRRSFAAYTKRDASWHTNTHTSPYLPDCTMGRAA